MIRILVLSISILLISSCNIAFWISKDNIVNVKQGYFVIVANNQYVEFVPSKIDTSLELSENLAKHKLGKAFYLYGLSSKTLNHLKIFGDTISNGWVIIPVEFEYRQKKEVNHQLRKQHKQYHEHFIKVDDKIYPYQICIPSSNIRYINAFPFLSEEKKRYKTKNYED